MAQELEYEIPEYPRDPHRSTINAGGILVTRVQSLSRESIVPFSNERQDAFLVSTQLLDYDHLKLLRNGEPFFEGSRLTGSIVIEDLRHKWEYHPLSTFDSVSFQIPVAHIRAFATNAGRPQLKELSSPPNATDEVILGLAKALLPALQNPDTANLAFLNQIDLAILTHLAQAYGGVHFPARRRGTLAPWQEKRATKILSENIVGPVSIEALASACEVSKSYFVKAFRDTFGKTPYRWLTEYRVIVAKERLLSDMSIADVAASCGFSDQSHMTRVFSDISGESPGSWRRRNKS